MQCLSCSRGLHFECSDMVYSHCCCANEDDQPVDEEKSTSPRRTYKGNNVSISAGRKRAAVEHPIDPEASCDWQGLANCGGGLFPIVGCIKGKQEHRHHGPDKTTTNNHAANIHRICTTCHNRWHAKNNKVYNVEIFKETAHKPRPATVDDYMGE